MQSLESLISVYFRQPDPDAMVDAFAAETVTSAWQAGTVLTLPVFLALMLDNAPDSAERLVEVATGGHPAKIEVVAQALNYSHHPRRRLLMEKLVGEQAAASMDEDGADFKDFQPGHPVHVDMLWAAFFATGDGEYVERVAALLSGWMHLPNLEVLLERARTEDTVRQRALDGVLSRTAMQGLSAHAQEYQEVRDALARVAARQDGIVSALCARLLAGVESA